MTWYSVLMHRFVFQDLRLCKPPKGPRTSGWFWSWWNSQSMCSMCAVLAGRFKMTVWVWTISHSSPHFTRNAGRRSWQAEQVEVILSVETQQIKQFYPALFRDKLFTVNCTQNQKVTKYCSKTLWTGSLIDFIGYVRWIWLWYHGYLVTWFDETVY